MSVTPSLMKIMNFPKITKSHMASSQNQKRRSSSRSIKRKKFDDELVESSLVKPTKAKTVSGASPVLPPSSNPAPTFNFSAIPHASTSQVQVEPETFISPSRPKFKPSRKHLKRFKNCMQMSKDIGRWKPTDDLSLILSIQQTNDLETVYRGVEFSCKFTLHEIKERWYSLLYVAAISKVAFAAMKQIPDAVVAQIKAKVLFSTEEENLMASVRSTEGSIEVFQRMLEKHVKIFLPERTAKALYDHWTLMKKFNLLLDQAIHKAPPGDSILSFSDAEEFMDDSKLLDDKDNDLQEEMVATDHIAKREIKQLENELPKWQVLVDSVIGTNNEEFHANTLAVLKGRIVRYLMQSREITLGRSTQDNIVDIDLSLEGPASKISRRQGIIRLENNGDFFIMNEARRSIYVDGKPVLIGNKLKLGNESVVEIVGLKFIFLVNHEHILSLQSKP